MTPRTLGIENALERAGDQFIEKYRLMKNRLLNVEYEHWAAGFAEGNNHGRGHITRVLENLDHLLGPKPLAHISSYELFLAMMAVLYHDIGLLRQRKGHEEISKSLLEGDENDAYVINLADKEIIAAAVVSHSSSKDIAQECSRFSSEEIIGKQKARPKVVAALVRLADELDEDYRRADAILQRRLNLPSDSGFFWIFCQRVRAVRPNLDAKRIDLNFAPEPEDTIRYGPIPGGRRRHFIAFCADKFAKINQERVKMNQFLPPELQYSVLHVDVKPVKKHSTWTSPRTFTFNDHTTSLIFIQSFPELLDKPAKDTIRRILGLMKNKDFTVAQTELDQLASILLDLPVETQMRVLFNRACLASMRAATQPGQSSNRKQLLDQAAKYLVEWFEMGRNGAFDALGRTLDAEIHRMMADRDLSLVLLERRTQLRKAMPNAPWPTSRGVSGSGHYGFGGGCVPFGTLVETPNGKRGVEHLRIGEEVVSVCIGTSTERKKAMIASIRTSRTFRCIQLTKDWLVTPDQPIRTADRWIEAIKVENGDRVMDGSGQLVAIEHLQVIEDYFEVYELSIEAPLHNYVANGLLCHNKDKV